MSFNYSVLSFVLDEGAVPVGVAMWSEERRWCGLKLIDDSDRLKRIADTRSRTLISMTGERIRRWLELRRLPGAAVDLDPTRTAWWDHLRRLLIHRIRLNESHSVDVADDPARNLALLFESFVGSHRASKKEKRQRVDGAVRECLGELANRFVAKETIEGFGDRDVRVMRAYRGERGYVVVEGVNLAGDDAEMEIDAATSRLQRLKEGPRAGEIDIVLGYLPSAHGLNGETALVQWARQKTGAAAFDLRCEAAELQAATKRLIDRANGQVSSDAE